MNQTRRLGESRRYLVRFPDYRAAESSLRTLDLEPEGVDTHEKKLRARTGNSLLARRIL